MTSEPGPRAHAEAAHPAGVTLDAARFDAVVFDLDGVLTSTAEQHARAWKRLFDAFLEERAADAGEDFVPFGEHDDYLSYVDGKPRYDGVESFLQSRGIDLARGAPSEAPGSDTISALGNRKDAYYQELIREEGVHLFPSSLRLLDALSNAGCLVALISASRNTMEVIAAAGIEDRFDAIVDGVRADDLRLAGKPAPDIFLRAVEDLGVPPAQAAVLEDSEAGVEAARAGGFGLVIGVERTGRGGRLSERGAQAEVADLDEIAVSGRTAPRAARSRPDAFTGLDAILARARGRRIAVFLDYDGTLTPIVERPDMAVLADDMRETVRRLGGATPVAIVSGRDLEDVRAMVGLEGLFYAGSHGFQMRDRDGHEEVREEALPYRDDLQAAADDVARRLADLRGAVIERKGFAVAAHYRQVAEDQQDEVRARVERVAAAYPRLRVTGGKKVVELRPALAWDKGRAVQALLERWGGGDIFPIYVGDDETDEDAFRALRGRGVGIVVGDVPDTQALYRLDDVPDVGRWLEALRARLAGDGT